MLTLTHVPPSKTSIKHPVLQSKYSVEIRAVHYGNEMRFLLYTAAATTCIKTSEGIPTKDHVDDHPPVKKLVGSDPMSY